jgi:aminopeptidase YwaD
MSRVEEVLCTLAGEIGERPTGTAANEAANRYLAGIAVELGYEVTELPFRCRRWEFGASGVMLVGSGGGEKPGPASPTYPIHPGPFSGPLSGRVPVAAVESVAELREREVAGSLLVIRGPLAQEPFMPRDFPFYFPDEHREFLDLLLEKRPAGLLALTGKHPLCGLSPYPLFEDGNLGIPNAYASDPEGVIAEAATAEIALNSKALPAAGRQLVFSRPGRGEGAVTARVILAAHMDTKYETPGALDNAAGVATLVSVMERLRDVALPFPLDVVPFNGEEYYEVSGQLAYLAHREHSAESTPLVINLDGLGHPEAESAFSFYNLEPQSEAQLGAHIGSRPRMCLGEQWIAGDHAIFAFRGIPCIAVTSSNLMEEVIRLTHTPEDTLDTVDSQLLEETAELVVELIRSSGATPHLSSITQSAERSSIE